MRTKAAAQLEANRDEDYDVLKEKIYSDIKMGQHPVEDFYTHSTMVYIFSILSMLRDEKYDSKNSAIDITQWEAATCRKIYGVFTEHVDDLVEKELEMILHRKPTIEGG